MRVSTKRGVIQRFSQRILGLRRPRTGLGCVLLGSSGCGGVEFASYAEPPDDVVTKASPGSFHRCLLLSPASKLPESTSLFDPGVRELRDLRSLAVNCFCLFGLHLGFESSRRSRILAASDGAHPFGSLLLVAALIAQGTATACCFGCSVYLRAHTVLAVLHHMESESFASGTEVDIVLSIVRKRATDKRSIAAVGVIFGRFPAVLPGTIEIDLRGLSGLHRGMIGVVTIGHYLLR